MQENTLEIRPAEKEDIGSMMDLIRELAIYEKAPEEVTVSLEEFRESGFGENPVYTAFVAVMEGKIIGLALMYIRYSTWKGQRNYLEDLVVSERYRGLGIGKKLFDRCLWETHEKGLNGMVWQVLNWNEPAIHFYKKYPYKHDPEWINCSLEKEQIKAILGK
jgi:GNAT superfamily N-acetyltransferase